MGVRGRAVSRVVSMLPAPTSGCALRTGFLLNITLGGANPLSIWEQHRSDFFFLTQGHSLLHLSPPPASLVYFCPVKRASSTAPSRGEEGHDLDY